MSAVVRCAWMATLVSAAWLGTGCEASKPTFARAAADSASLMFRAGRSGVEGHIDPSFVGDGLPTLLLNMEAIYRVVPDNHVHAVALLQTYCEYIEGWLDGPEQAERARRLAEHAREIGLGLMRERHRKVDAWLRGDTEELRRYLRNRYRGERSASLLFWTAKAWALQLQTQPENKPSWELLALDAMVERATVISPELGHGGALSLLGQVRVWLAADGQGSLGAAQESFERALEVSSRTNLAVLLTYAESYARAANDEGLRSRLLEEAMAMQEDPDALRLSNVLARDRMSRTSGGE